MVQDTQRKPLRFSMTSALPSFFRMARREVYRYDASRKRKVHRDYDEFLTAGACCSGFGIPGRWLKPDIYSRHHYGCVRGSRVAGLRCPGGAAAHYGIMLLLGAVCLTPPSVLVKLASGWTRHCTARRRDYRRNGRRRPFASGRQSALTALVVAGPPCPGVAVGLVGRQLHSVNDFARFKVERR